MNCTINKALVIESIKMSAINLSIIPSNTPSLCIPRVIPNIDEARIRRIFDELSLGELERIDIVKKTTEKGEKFNRVFVHFAKWNKTEEAVKVRTQMLTGKEIKIIYDDPLFWKVSALRTKEKPKPAPRAPREKKISICFDDEEEEQEKKPKVVSRPPAKINFRVEYDVDDETMKEEEKVILKEGAGELVPPSKEVWIF